MIDWVDNDLRAWGAWAARQEDGAGYPKTSPLSNFGMPTNDNRGGATLGEWTPAEISVTGDKLARVTPTRTRQIAATHYKNGAIQRRTVRLMNLRLATIQRALESAQTQIARMA